PNYLQEVRPYGQVMRVCQKSTCLTLAPSLVGVYTLIPSTFESGKASQAFIRLESTVPLEVSIVPQEGAGMFSRVVKGRWSSATAAGRPSLGSYESNPRYELLLPEPASVFCRLLLSSPTLTSIPISIAIFKRGPSGSLKDQVSTSGPYADPISGVVTPLTYLEAGIYVAVPSTYAARIEESFTISVYATRKLELAAV
ncbi:cysteine protease, partial [Naganishia albida]